MPQHQHDSQQTPDSRIADDHALLGDLLGRLAAARQIDDFGPVLDQLREFLVAHFEMEEAHDGLVAVVQDAAPHQVALLDALFAEHLAILKRLDAISDQVDAAKAACERVVAESAVLIEQLRSHEDRENELIIDTLNRDLGGGD